MALVRVAQYGSVPGPVTDYQAQNAHLQAFTNQLLTQQFILDAGTAKPVIKQGAYVSHGGSLYVADADTSITGSPSDGSVYIRVSGSTSLTVEFINNISGYTWNPVYTALTSGSYTLLPYLIIKVGAVWTRYNFNPNNQSFGGTLRVTGAISGHTINTGQGANELYPMNQGVRTTDPVSFATINTGQGANKLYPMNQAVRITDNPTFANAMIGGHNVDSELDTLNSRVNQGVKTTDSPTFSTLGFASLNPDNSTETSIQVSAGASQVLPKGAYTIIMNPSIVCQVKHGSNWFDILSASGGFVISDGVNFRLFNSSSGTRAANIRKW